MGFFMSFFLVVLVILDFLEFFEFFIGVQEFWVIIDFVTWVVNVEGCLGLIGKIFFGINDFRKLRGFII